MPNRIFAQTCVQLDAEEKGMGRSARKVVGLARLVLACWVTGIDFYLSAEHDQIWASGPNPSSMGSGGAETMDDLGWFWEDDTESWSTFV